MQNDRKLMVIDFLRGSWDRDVRSGKYQDDEDRQREWGQLWTRHGIGDIDLIDRVWGDHDEKENDKMAINIMGITDLQTVRFRPDCT